MGVGLIRRPSAIASIACISLGLASSLWGEEWPQWRGPHLDGSSLESELPIRWSPQDSVAWRLALPTVGASSPVTAGSRLFLTGGDDLESSDRLWLMAVDRNRGTIDWRRELGAGNEFKRKHTLASPSPVTDGETVWALTGTGELAAFTVDGRPGWRRNLQEDYGRFGILWGYAASPLLHEGSLYIPVLHGFETDDPSYVLRIDGRTGKTVWRVERPTLAERESPDAYTTPTLWKRGGRSELIIVGGDVVTGHDLASGRERWRVEGLNPQGSGAQRLVASPLVHGETLFAFGKRGPALALRSADPQATPTVVWSVRESTDVPTPVAHDGLLFTVTDRGIAWCHDIETGSVVWGPERLSSGPYSASPVVADGRIYATSEAGVTTVLRASQTFAVLAENDLGEYTLASPAISDGQIFVRTAEALWALGDRRAEP